MMQTAMGRQKIFGMVLSMLTGACAAPTSQGQLSSKDMKDLSERLRAVEAYQGEQECGNELRRLLYDARAECRAGTGDAAAPDGGEVDGATHTNAEPGAATAQAASEDDKCSSDQLRGAMKAAERELNQGSIASGKRKVPRLSPVAQMLDRFRCEVLYLDGESETIPGQRLNKLMDLAQLPQLPQTKYIILASSLSGEIEARHRADVMRRELMELKIATEKIEKSWIYPFSLQAGQIHKGGLLPKIPVETPDLDHAVWVCRTSC